MNVIRTSEPRTLRGLKKARASEVRKLKGLKNISWLTTRQLNKLAGALSVNGVERRTQIFDERDSSDNVYVLLSGVARVTCRNRKGRRAVVIMLAPGMIPAFPLPVVGINYNFRCEAVTNCNGAPGLERIYRDLPRDRLGGVQADGGQLYRAVGFGAVALL